MNLKEIWDIQPFCLMESHFLVYWSLAFLVVLNFLLIHPSMWCQITPLKPRHATLAYLPIWSVKAVGICCVFWTYVHDSECTYITPFDEETRFLEGFVHSGWIVSSHYTHGKENLYMKVAFFLKPRPLARLQLSFEEQLCGLFEHPPSAHAGRWLIGELMTFCYHCLWIVQHRG